MTSPSPSPFSTTAAPNGYYDVHTHYYPPTVSQDPRKWACDRKEAHWLQLVTPANAKSLQDWATPTRMLKDMDEAGISKAVLLGWYWEHQETAEEQNQWVAELIHSYPDRFIAFAALNPESGERAHEELIKNHERGFQGIGELHLNVQKLRNTSESWQKILAYAQQHGLPINFHVTEQVGREHPGHIETPYRAFQWIAQNYPQLKIILAHWGGLLPFYELNPHIKKCFQNVYYDTAAGPLLYDPRIWRQVIDIVGAEKILFGSDYPLKLFPRTQTQADFTSYIESMRKAGISEDEWRAILHDNAKKLFG